MNGWCPKKSVLLAALMPCVFSCASVYHSKPASPEDERGISTTRVGLILESAVNPTGNLDIQVQRVLYGAAASTTKDAKRSEVQLGPPKPCENCKTDVMLGSEIVTQVHTDFGGKATVNADLFTINSLYRPDGTYQADLKQRLASIGFAVEGIEAGRVDSFWVLKWYEAQAWEVLQRSFTVEAINAFVKQFPFSAHKDELMLRRDCLVFASDLKACPSQDPSVDLLPYLDSILATWRSKSGYQWPCRFMPSASWKSRLSECRPLMADGDAQILDQCETRLVDREQFLLSKWKKEQLETALQMSKDEEFDPALSILEGILELFPGDEAILKHQVTISKAKARAEAKAAAEQERISREEKRQEERENRFWDRCYEICHDGAPSRYDGMYRSCVRDSGCSDYTCMGTVLAECGKDTVSTCTSDCVDEWPNFP